jgi:hypothetical protein
VHKFLIHGSVEERIVALQAKQQARDIARAITAPSVANRNDEEEEEDDGAATGARRSHNAVTNESSVGGVGGFSDVDVLTLDELFAGNDIYSSGAQHASLSVRAGGNTLDGSARSGAGGRAFIGPVAATDISGGSVAVQSRKEVMSLQDLVEALGQDGGAHQHG